MNISKILAPIVLHWEGCDVMGGDSSGFRFWVQALLICMLPLPLSRKASESSWDCAGIWPSSQFQIQLASVLSAYVYWEWRRGGGSVGTCSGAGQSTSTCHWSVPSGAALMIMHHLQLACCIFASSRDVREGRSSRKFFLILSPVCGAWLPLSTHMLRPNHLLSPHDFSQLSV